MVPNASMMRRLTCALVLLIAAACSPSSAPAKPTTPLEQARFGNIDVKDATGTTRTYQTTVSGGVHTGHTIVDSLPAVAQGTTNGSHAQAWKVQLSDGSGALGTSGAPLRTQDLSSSATGSAVPSKATFVAGSSGGTEVGLKVSSDGTLQAESRPPTSSTYAGQVTVTDSAAVRIDTGTSHALLRGYTMNCASGGGDVYAGTTSGVTSSNGFKIPGGDKQFFEEANTNTLYFRADTGSVVCTVYGN